MTATNTMVDGATTIDIGDAGIVDMSSDVGSTPEKYYYYDNSDVNDDELVLEEGSASPVAITTPSMLKTKKTTTTTTKNERRGEHSSSSSSSNASREHDDEIDEDNEEDSAYESRSSALSQNDDNAANNKNYLQYENPAGNFSRAGTADTTTGTGATNRAEGETSTNHSTAPADIIAAANTETADEKGACDNNFHMLPSPKSEVASQISDQQSRRNNDNNITANNKSIMVTRETTYTSDASYDDEGLEDDNYHADDDEVEEDRDRSHRRSPRSNKNVSDDDDHDEKDENGSHNGSSTNRRASGTNNGDGNATRRSSNANAAARSSAAGHTKCCFGKCLLSPAWKMALIIIGITIIVLGIAVAVLVPLLLRQDRNPGTVQDAEQGGEEQPTEQGGIFVFPETSWEPVGSATTSLTDVHSPQPDDGSGSSLIALSFDGTVMAVGAPYASSPDGELTNVGRITIYKKEDENDEHWIAQSSFYGLYENAQLGHIMDLSPDGSMLTVVTMGYTSKPDDGSASTTCSPASSSSDASSYSSCGVVTTFVFQDDSSNSTTSTSEEASMSTPDVDDESTSTPLSSSATRFRTRIHRITGENGEQRRFLQGPTFGSGFFDPQTWSEAFGPNSEGSSTGGGSSSSSHNNIGWDNVLNVFQDEVEGDGDEADISVDVEMLPAPLGAASPHNDEGSASTATEGGVENDSGGLLNNLINWAQSSDVVQQTIDTWTEFLDESSLMTDGNLTHFLDSTVSSTLQVVDNAITTLGVSDVDVQEGWTNSINTVTGTSSSGSTSGTTFDIVFVTETTLDRLKDAIEDNLIKLQTQLPSSNGNGIELFVNGIVNATKESIGLIFGNVTTGMDDAFWDDYTASLLQQTTLLMESIDGNQTMMSFGNWSLDDASEHYSEWLINYIEHYFDLLSLEYNFPNSTIENTTISFLLMVESASSSFHRLMKTLSTKANRYSERMARDMLYMLEFVFNELQEVESQCNTPTLNNNNGTSTLLEQTQQMLMELLQQLGNKENWSSIGSGGPHYNNNYSSFSYYYSNITMSEGEGEWSWWENEDMQYYHNNNNSFYYNQSERNSTTIMEEWDGGNYYSYYGGNDDVFSSNYSGTIEFNSTDFYEFGVNVSSSLHSLEEWFLQMMNAPFDVESTNVMSTLWNEWMILVEEYIGKTDTIPTSEWWSQGMMVQQQQQQHHNNDEQNNNYVVFVDSLGSQFLATINEITPTIMDAGNAVGMASTSVMDTLLSTLIHDASFMYSMIWGVAFVMGAQWELQNFVFENLINDLNENMTIILNDMLYEPFVQSTAWDITTLLIVLDGISNELLGLNSNSTTTTTTGNSTGNATTTMDDPVCTMAVRDMLDRIQIMLFHNVTMLWNETNAFQQEIQNDIIDLFETLISDNEDEWNAIMEHLSLSSKEPEENYYPFPPEEFVIDGSFNVTNGTDSTNITEANITDTISNVDDNTTTTTTIPTEGTISPPESTVSSTDSRWNILSDDDGGIGNKGGVQTFFVPGTVPGSSTSTTSSGADSDGNMMTLDEVVKVSMFPSSIINNGGYNMVIATYVETTLMSNGNINVDDIASTFASSSKGRKSRNPQLLRRRRTNEEEEEEETTSTAPGGSIVLQWMTHGGSGDDGSMNAVIEPGIGSTDRDIITFDHPTTQSSSSSTSASSSSSYTSATLQQSVFDIPIGRTITGFTLSTNDGTVAYGTTTTITPDESSSVTASKDDGDKIIVLSQRMTNDDKDESTSSATSNLWQESTQPPIMKEEDGVSCLGTKTSLDHRRVFGQHLTLSSNGRTLVASSSARPSSSAVVTTEEDDDLGDCLLVFERPKDSQWEQKGSTLKGLPPIQSLQVSSDGLTVIANFRDSSEDMTEHDNNARQAVIVFVYDTLSDDETRVDWIANATISAKNQENSTEDQGNISSSGTVSMSGDGTLVAVGTPFSTTGSSEGEESVVSLFRSPRGSPRKHIWDACIEQQLTCEECQSLIEQEASWYLDHIDIIDWDAIVTLEYDESRVRIRCRDGNVDKAPILG